MATTGLTLLFYVLAAAATVAALGAVTSRHILRAALHLMVVLIVTAGLYLMLDAEFLTGVQILVYVGGIVVLLAFAIMLTASAELLEDRPSLGRKVVGLLAAGAFFVITLHIYASYPFPPGVPPPRATDDVVVLGRMLLDRGAGGYVLPFEVVSLLLLAVVIGAIVVARRKPAADAAEQKGGTPDARLP